MSVLIRDMKKPEKCGVCPMRGYSLCPLTKKEVLWNLLDDDCPLIEVPEPHGRLVDADALLKLIDSCMFPSDMVTTRAVSMATNWIKEAPTVIPADKDGES